VKLFGQAALSAGRAHFGRDAGAREVLSIQRRIRAVVRAKVSQTKARNYGLHGGKPDEIDDRPAFLPGASVGSFSLRPGLL
jgi:hypothetical protein